MPIQHITGDAPSSHLPFSPAVQAGPFVFISGQASVDGQGKFVPGSFEEEFRRSISNVEAVLATAGMTFKDLVKITSYVDSADNLPEYNRLYGEVFSAPYPARTTIVNCLSGTGLKFEVDAIAWKEIQ